jgi:hypothetical protein
MRQVIYLGYLSFIIDLLPCLALLLRRLFLLLFLLLLFLRLPRLLSGLVVVCYYFSVERVLG